MKRILLTLLTLVLASLACSQPIPNAVPVPTSTALGVTETAESPNEWTTTVIRPLVNVRKSPNGAVVDTLRTGTEVEIVQCSGNWCKIREPAGYVWRGCLSDNPAKLGCAAK